MFPQASVANQVLVNTSGHVPEVPESVNVITGVPSQLSVAVAVPVVAGNVLEPHSTVIFAGHVMIGMVLSNIVMDWAHVAELPQLSVALYVLTMVN